MVEINLASGGMNKEKPASGSKALIFLALLLILILAAYGGLYFYSGQLKKSIVQAKSEYQEKFDLLKAGNGREVADFQDRMDTIKGMITERKNTRDVLLEVEKKIVSGVYVKSFSYQSKADQTTLVFGTNNYNLVAKQILSLKNSTLFSSVDGGETSYSAQDGTISFTVVVRSQSATGGPNDINS